MSVDFKPGIPYPPCSAMTVPSITETPQTDTRGQYCPPCCLSYCLSPRIALTPTLGLTGAEFGLTLCDSELISLLSLSRLNPGEAGVCPWCVIQARRVKCETCLNRWIENSKDVWMCWSTMPMLGSRCFLNFNLSSTSDLPLWPLTPHPHWLSLLLSSPFLPPEHTIHHSSCTFQPILNNSKKSFWESPASIWDDINNVGLR